MRRFKGAWAVAFAAALVLSACGGGSSDGGQTDGATAPADQPSAEGTRTIAVFVSNGGDPYFQNKSYGYSLAAEELADFTVEVFDAGGYENIERQIKQVEDAIQRGVAAIVILPVDAVALCDPLAQAVDAGIVVVLDDSMLNCDYTVPAGISENSVQVGFNQCAYLAEAIGGSGGIALMKGPSGAGIAQERAQGCLDALEGYPNVKILDQQWGASNIETGTTLMEDFLTAYGEELDAVYTFGAVTAMGAANAAEAAGKQPGDVKLVGIDYGDEVLKYVEEGWIDGIIPAQPVYLARNAVLIAAALVNGESIADRGAAGIDPCCEIRAYTGDDDVFDRAALATYDPAPAVAPAGWVPKFRT